MLKSRLEGIATELMNKIEAASEARQRAIGEAVSTLAVRSMEVNDPTVERGLQALRSGQYGSAPLISELQHAVDDLDSVYFDAYEKFEAGEGDKATYMRLFAKARAASAVMFALHKDPFEAAAEATYEAYSAIGDEPFELANRMLG